LLKSRPEVIAAGQWSAESSQARSVAGGLRNLVRVTLGDVVGGAGLVGGICWFIYLRQGSREST
jgi:formate/nitrite transporter FocA (FNT family)